MSRAPRVTRVQFPKRSIMSSSRQIEANRRNARLSTGPVTAEGKQRSRRNAIRHGLTAETVIPALEDADDYTAFEMAITADFDATSAVERELVLRLASLLWRLRRATAIESGLLRIKARQLGQPQRTCRQRHKEIDGLCGVAQQTLNEDERNCNDHNPAQQSSDDLNELDDLTRSYFRLASLPICPLDRISRYEARLWRQTCQILFSLRYLSRHKPWTRARSPYRHG